MIRASWLQAARIALNYLPVLFAAVSLAGFLAITVGPLARLGPAVLLVPFVGGLVWLRRCRVVLAENPVVLVVNPLRTWQVRPGEVVDVRLHFFVLGKDACPELVTASGSRIAVVAAAGQDWTIEDWKRLLDPLSS